MRRVARLVQEAIARGKREYAAFDAERYARLALASGMRLGKAVVDSHEESSQADGKNNGDGLDHDDDASDSARAREAADAENPRDKVISGYLHLLAEALVAGHLDQSFFGHVWTEHIPATLGDVAPDEQLATMARVWNLCEGLAREPEWLGEYVFAHSHSDAIGPLDDLDRFLTRVLEPALQPVQAAGLTPPFQVSVLDPRPQDDEFIPDAIMLCAPHVVGIKDLRRESYVALLYRQRGESRFFGPLGSLTEFRETSPAPAIAIEDGAVTVADHAIELPRVGRVRSYLAARAGFIVVTAHDSQRIWLIESSA